MVGVLASTTGDHEFYPQYDEPNDCKVAVYRS